MKKMTTLCFTVLAVLTLFGQKPLMTKYIPSTARLVVNFDPLQLGRNIPGEHFRGSVLYRELMKKDSKELKAFFSNPEVFGIDFSARIWVVATSDGMQPGIPATNIFGVLKDEALFAKTVEQLLKDDQEIRVYGTNKVLLPSGMGAAVAWNNEVFVMTIPGKNSMPVTTRDYPDDEEIIAEDSVMVMVDTAMITVDTLVVDSDEDYAKGWEAEQEKKMKDLRNYCFELLTPKAANAVTLNPAFIQVMSETGDVRMWNDGSQNMMMPQVNPFAKELSRLTSLTGNYKTSVINFEKGKITGNSYSFPGEEAIALYKKYPQPPAPVELTRRLPKGEVLGMFLGSFNTSLLRELFKGVEIRGLMDSIKKAIPFADKLSGVFQESAMIAVLKTGDTSGKLKGVEVIFAIPVADRTKLEQLRDGAGKKLDSMMKTEKGAKMFRDVKPAVRYNDKFFVISTSAATAQSFLDNDGSSPVPQWLNDTRFPVMASIDIGEILKMILAKSTKNSQGGMPEKVYELMDHIRFSGGNFNNDRLEGRVEVGFSNMEDNAILQIFDLVNYLISLDAKRKQERQKEMQEE